MRFESRLFQFGSIPFLITFFAYGFLTQWKEFVGAVCLLLLAIMTAMVGFYLWNTARKLDARPEDDPRGEISDAEGDYGFFSPRSWWPLPLAASALLCFLGLAVGWWVFLVGFIFAVISLLGWSFEYFRGDLGI